MIALGRSSGGSLDPISQSDDLPTVTIIDLGIDPPWLHLDGDLPD